MNSSSDRDSYNSLLSSGSIFVGDVLKAAFHGGSWHRMVAATIVPLMASALWYLSRTVIRVTDSEQAMWIRMWLCSQQKALQRVRKLRLLSPTDKMGPRQDMDRYDPFSRRNKRSSAEEDDDREGGGRFAPPKLEFLPANNVPAWSWFGWWPVSIVSTYGNNSGNPGYTLTIWFAPWGTTIARDMLFQGRQMWLAKRAKKTEIWMADRSMGKQFKILSRPSRPLSTVIVENGIKETLLEDTKQFLNSEKWYYDKGIPYRRGFLLHGPPGCGKTSLITALAGELRLPIIFIQLEGDGMSDQVLMNCLSDAPRDSMVLIEDIDCALRNSSAPASGRQMRRMGVEGVTLSGLLNALDGVAAQEGRLLFMTTNHLDKLDDALTRPGRVDVKFYLGKASKAAAGELFDQFFASSLNEGTFTSVKICEARSTFVGNVEDGMYSFAALQGALMMARDDPGIIEEAMKRLSEQQAHPEQVSLHCSHCKGATGQCGCLHGCEAPEEAECESLHLGVKCDNCMASDFGGARYRCSICHNFDLCENCYDSGAHDLEHSFWKISRFGATPEKTERKMADVKNNGLAAEDKTVGSREALNWKMDRFGANPIMLENLLAATKEMTEPSKTEMGSRKMAGLTAEDMTAGLGSRFLEERSFRPNPEMIEPRKTVDVKNVLTTKGKTAGSKETFMSEDATN